METTINAKTLRAELPQVMERVRKGERFTVLYRSRPVCRIVPAESADSVRGRVEEDSLFQAGAVGRSSDKLSAADHDQVLYGKRRR